MASMRTSVICRLSRPGGFTLLEMLVVLVVMAGLAAIAGPRLMTMYDSVRAAAERDDVLDQIRSLTTHAWREGRKLEFTGWPVDGEADEGDAARHLDLPEGWTVEVAEPIIFRQTGACLGGEITLTFSERQYHYELAAPYCEVGG